MRIWFQAFTFKCNLCRYAMAETTANETYYFSVAAGDDATAANCSNGTVVRNKTELGLHSLPGVRLVTRTILAITNLCFDCKKTL